MEHRRSERSRSQGWTKFKIAEKRCTGRRNLLRSIATCSNLYKICKNSQAKCFNNKRDFNCIRLTPKNKNVLRCRTFRCYPCLFLLLSAASAAATVSTTTMRSFATFLCYSFPGALTCRRQSSLRFSSALIAAFTLIAAAFILAT